MSATGTASVTSLNFQGFEDFARNGTSPILFNQIYIAPEPPTTAGKWIHPLAGFVPGQQSYLKRKMESEPGRFGPEISRLPPPDASLNMRVSFW